VENEAQFNRIASAGCQFVQGYYFSRAVSPEQFAGFLRPGHALTSCLAS
jgi:EAL domain-containing protein (putative c-di-GMP-specific phosphodiesterase class I)